MKYIAIVLLCRTVTDEAFTKKLRVKELKFYVRGKPQHSAIANHCWTSDHLFT